MRTITAAVVSSLASSFALAGPLTPPPGAVASTGKTIEEAEPRIAINQANTPGSLDGLFVISQPGSYYLTGNITSPGGRTALFVTASNVTIDLNGFTVSSSNSGSSGIAILSNKAVTIRNGTLEGWFNGIDASLVDRGIYEYLILIGNSGSGITAGDQSVVRDCVAEGNTADGIRVLFNSTVSGCTSVGNGREGIFVSVGSTVTGCTAIGNSSDGIVVGPSSTITACNARDNSGNGFIISTASSISGCTATDNGTDGFSVNNGSTVSGCVAENNGAHGFDVGSGVVVTDCAASVNTLNGIDANNECRVTNNACDSNSGWGILGTSDTTVDSNTVTDNGTAATATGGGIRCTGGLIIRNTLSGNNVISIDTSNAEFGPILTNVGEITSTNPWANIVY